jgi:cell volume regulation protein A
MFLVILVVTGLVIVSALTSVIAFRVGAPLLLVFLTIGLLAGEDGPGGIHFDDAESVYFFGSIALAIILYDSGFNTKARSFRVAAAPSILLATFGVVLTAAIVGLGAHLLFGFSYFEGLLLGSIIGSTDAAAVFFLLRVGGITIRDRVRSTLEVESSSNDPIAILLTAALVDLLARQDVSPGLIGFAWLIVQQMGLGLLLGIAGGLVIVQIVNRFRLEPGLYPIVSVGLAMLTFAGTGLAGGSGFLAAYVAGLIAGNAKVRGLMALRRFQDGLSWVCQIAMFLLLGLQATPSQFADVAVQGIGVAAILTFVARPIAVWLCLWPFRYRQRDTAFIAWVGLRGAVSVLLAVLPIVGGLADSQSYFNITFIAVLASLLLQGGTIRPVARLLGQAVPPSIGPIEKIAIELPGGTRHELVSYLIVPESRIAKGERLPRWARPSLIVRDGATVRLQDAGRLRSGDYVYIFVAPRFIPLLDRLFASPVATPDEDAALFGQFELDPRQPISLVAKLYGTTMPATDQSIADYIEHKLSGPAEVGDRVDLGALDLIVRGTDDSGQVKTVGLYCGTDQETVRKLPLFLGWDRVAMWVRSKWRRSLN